MADTYNSELRRPAPQLPARRHFYLVLSGGWKKTPKFTGATPERPIYPAGVCQLSVPKSTPKGKNIKK